MFIKKIKRLFSQEFNALCYFIFLIKKFCNFSVWDKKYCFGHLKKNKNAFKGIFYKSSKNGKKRFIFNAFNHFLINAKLRILPDDLSA
jgi:hypothetical protein